MIFNSPIGKFEFHDDVLLSHAKLVRDTVVGQWLNPKPGAKRLKTLKDVHEFMASHSSNLLTKLEFDLSLADHVPHAAEETELEDLPQPPMIQISHVWARQALIGTERPAWLDA